MISQKEDEDEDHGICSLSKVLPSSPRVCVVVDRQALVVAMIVKVLHSDVCGHSRDDRCHIARYVSSGIYSTVRKCVPSGQICRCLSS